MSSWGLWPTNRQSPSKRLPPGLAPEPPVAVDIDVVFAGVPVADLERAVAWYSRFFGRPPDVKVPDVEVMWVVRSGAWVRVLRDTGRAGSALVTLAVADLDELVGALDEREIDHGPITTVPGAGRKTDVADPDGNAVSFVEVSRTG
jgi:predicted enzyme related to lactoylglutathione lyase